MFLKKSGTGTQTNRIDENVCRTYLVGHAQSMQVCFIPYVLVILTDRLDRAIERWERGATTRDVVRSRRIHEVEAPWGARVRRTPNWWVALPKVDGGGRATRSEERRVGKERRSGR